MRLKIMKYIQKIVAGCIGLCLFACTETDELKTTAGKTGFVVSLTDGSVGVESRKTPAELNVPKTEFTIKVWKAGSDELVASAPCTGETGQVIEVGTGVYDVTAEAGENPLIALDAPYYKGFTEDQRVDADKTTNVSIACKVANSLVSVKYDEENLKFSDIYLDGYYVRVVAGGDSEDIKNVENSVYFRAGSAFEVYFCGMKIGETEEKQVKLDVGRTTLQAGDHLILTLSPEPDKYDLPLSITKVEVKQETINATIPMEWLPKPKVTAIGFDTSNTLTFVETEQKQAALNLNLSSALQDMKFKFNFEDKQFIGKLLKEEYLLSNAEDKQAIEMTLGITLPEIGATEASLDLSELVSKLQTNAGVTTNNTIEIDVQANNRWSSEDESANLTYTLACNKPEFSVDAYPGNIWTKEFTVNALREEQVTSGDFTTLSSKMTYQYSIDGETNWTTLNDGLRQDQLTPGTTYYIRGVYRGEVAGEVAELSTYPIIELENGNMEHWTKEGPLNEYTYWYVMYPWNEKDTKKYWNTVNLTTTQDGGEGSRWGNHALNTPYVWTSYVANSGTISTTDSNSGSAALIRTVGWGNGSTGGGSASVIKNVTPGELYLGAYDLSSHQPIYGIEYASRPTDIKFWCKYEPKSSDLMIAQILIMGENGETIGNASIPNNEAGATNWIEKTLHITYTDMENAPAKMYILFKSGTLTDTDVMDKPPFGNLSNGESVGSKLYIDDISLVYDK